MLGFGSAGQAFAKLLLHKQRELRIQYDCSISVIAITTGSRGTLLNDRGIDLERAIWEMEHLNRFDTAGPDYSQKVSMEVANDFEYDVLIELTPLAIFSGQPAINHIAVALNRGKHAITANKGPIAWAFESLRNLARKRGVLFYYETTVMDGTPVFNLVDETLKLCNVTEVKGILNSTTNFILEELAKGKSYDDALLEGKKRGFVEADPSMDIEGWDAAAKTAALLNVLMGADTTPLQIERRGIETVTSEMIRQAAQRGKVIKLLCSGVIENGTIIGRVEPAEIDQGDLLASISGTSSVVSIKTDRMGTISVVEHDPEIEQTGYGILSDLVRVIKNS